MVRLTIYNLQEPDEPTVKSKLNCVWPNLLMAHITDAANVEPTITTHIGTSVPQLTTALDEHFLPKAEWKEEKGRGHSSV